MSIQNKRIENITNHLLKSNLQNGILPDSKEFIWQLNQALKNVHYNKPEFAFRRYRNTELAASARLNNNNVKIHNDLLALYQNMITIYQLLNKQYQHFDIEKQKLEKEIDVLESYLVQFIRNNNRPGLLPYTYDTFDTTEKVDLQETSRIFIDTTSNEVHLVEEKNTSRQIFPGADITFKFEPNDVDKKEELITGNLSHILLSEIDKTWQKRYLLKENMAVSGTMQLLFDKAEMLNVIHLSTFTLKPFDLHVTYSPDGQNWYTLPYYENGFEVKKETVLSFPTVSISGIRLTVTKKEYDESLAEIDGYDYQYLFGFQSLAFYQKSYPTEGLFQTTCLPLINVPDNYLIDAVQLSVDETIHTGTDITYEIALPDTNLDWQPIDPINRKHPRYPQIIHFNRLKKGHNTSMYFPSDYSIRQSEAEDLLKNGIPLYRLTSDRNNKSYMHLPKIKMIEGSTRLYVGKDMWSVTSFPFNTKGYLPTINDFQKVNEYQSTAYMPTTKVASGDVFKNKTDVQSKMYLCRLAFYTPGDKTFQAAPVSTEPMTVFLNGEQLFSGYTTVQDNINYVFKAGWNEIVLLVNGENATTVNGMTVSLGFNPYALTDSIFSSSVPLREISLFDLQYNTKINDHSVFARRETAEGMEVLINFGQPGLTFDFYYDYRDEAAVDDGIYLRASFTRQNGENVPTPVLRQYRFDFS